MVHSSPQGLDSDLSMKFVNCTVHGYYLGTVSKSLRPCNFYIVYFKFF